MSTRRECWQYDMRSLVTEIGICPRMAACGSIWRRTAAYGGAAHRRARTAYPCVARPRTSGLRGWQETPGRGTGEGCSRAKGKLLSCQSACSNLSRSVSGLQKHGPHMATLKVSS